MILQGTTPILTISIDVNDMSLSDVSEVELTFKQFNKPIAIKRVSLPPPPEEEQIQIDYDKNTISYHFSEAETLELKPGTNLRWQLRVRMMDGEIVGTEISEIGVSDLLSEEVMSNESL